MKVKHMEMCLYSHQVLQVLFAFLVNPSTQSLGQATVHSKIQHVLKVQKVFSPVPTFHTLIIFHYFPFIATLSTSAIGNESIH